MPRALILGGSGAIGTAIAHRLLAAGWSVDLTGRDSTRLPSAVARAGGRFVVSDRDDPAALRAALGGGADLLVDCICFTAAQAELLRAVLAEVGSVVMLSSKAVYADALGNHSNSAVAPCFDGPIRESQATVPPSADGLYDSREGYGPNKVAAERVLLESGHPVTVVRPSKVHGPFAARAREWVFVRRALDRRPAIVLAHGGAGIDHPSAAANIAALVEAASAAPGARILNCADPDAPTVLEISRTIAGLLDHEWEEVLLGDDADPAAGRTPWDAEHPLVLDTSASLELGYEPVGDYAATVAAMVEWLVDAAGGGEGADRLPGPDDAFFRAFLDYASDERALRARRPSPVALRPVNAGNRAELEELRTSVAQERFVSGVSDSLQEAEDEPDGRALAWGVYADGTPVGFVMVSDEVGAPGYIPHYLWKLLIDERHQHRGYGTAALDEVVRYFRSRPGDPVDVLWTSAGTGPGSPIPFYERYGFEQTGDVVFDGERLLRLRIG